MKDKKQPKQPAQQSKQTTRLPADQRLKEILEEEGIVIDLQIRKVKSQDTGVWMDQPVILVDYGKTT